jgi:glycosyltransferase involved in cell wall biosynthesis
MHPRRVIMVGTSVETRGGIGAVVRLYREHGLFSRWPVAYVSTHCDGGRLRKTAAMLKGLATLGLELVRDRHAIVHVHSASRASFWRKALFMELAHAFGCPVIFHLHGGGFAEFYQRCGRLRQALVRRFLERAAQVVVLSEQWRRWVAERVPAASVTCIPNPVSDVHLVHAPARGRMILYVGRLDRAKGLVDLLEALSALRLRMPDATLVCAGDGDARTLRLEAEKLGVADAVSFTGWIGAEQRRALMQRASVFVLPSYFEAMPMSLLEAMAARLPVIATRVGGIPDVVEDGVSGLLFEPGDVAALHRLIARVLHDPALAARLAANGRRSVMAHNAAERVLGLIGTMYVQLGVQRSGGASHRFSARPSQETA